MLFDTPQVPMIVQEHSQTWGTLLQELIGGLETRAKTKPALSTELVSTIPELLELSSGHNTGRLDPLFWDRHMPLGDIPTSVFSCKRTVADARLIDAIIELFSRISIQSTVSEKRKALCWIVIKHLATLFVRDFYPCLIPFDGQRAIDSEYVRSQCMTTSRSKGTRMISVARYASHVVAHFRELQISDIPITGAEMRYSGYYALCAWLLKLSADVCTEGGFLEEQTTKLLTQTLFGAKYDVHQ